MEPERETLERVRRIETRITKIGNSLGIDVGGGKPVWHPEGRILLPSPNCSLGEVLKAIPDSERDNDVDIYVAGDYLATIFIDQ
jgi:hypothetical protein